MSYLGQEVKQVYPSNSAIGGENLGQVPLFAVMWCPSRDFIWDGYVAADGQELDDNLFPDAKAGIVGGRVPVSDAATWLADPTARASYVATSSAGKFRIPDLNGKFVGSLGAVFLRGDGARSADTKGVIQNDAFQGHRHQYGGVLGNVGTSGATALINYVNANTTQPVGDPVTDGVNGTPRTAAETRPLNATGCWVIKLFGSVVNVGAVDAGQLATVYAALQSEKVDIASFLGSNQNLSTTGYQKLPGGLIIQWGAGQTVSSTSVVVSFPIAFPNECLKAVVTHGSGAGILATGYSVLAPTDITLRISTSGNSTIHFIAIGY